MTFEEWAKLHVCCCPQCQKVAFAAWDAGRAELQAEGDLPPALSRAAIIDWPESEAGRRRLHDECAKIADIGGDAHTGYYRAGVRIAGEWQPDHDANQCRMVEAAVLAQGEGATKMELIVWATRDGSSACFQGVGVEWDPDKLIHAKTDETAICLAACIATLVPAP